MDGINNTSRPNFTGHSSTPFNANQAKDEEPNLPHSEPKHKKSRNYAKVIQLGYVVLFTGLLVLVIGIVLLLSLNNPTREDTIVNTGEYQGVFVNVTGSTGGQAYFGHIIQINTQYIVLNNVFYLQPGQTANQFTLNKLSCALYSPTDPMVINKAQVDFWENLNNNSKVAQDINAWNKDKLKCSTNSGSTTTPSTTSSSTSTTGTTTPSTSSSSTTSTTH